MLVLEVIGRGGKPLGFYDSRSSLCTVRTKRYYDIDRLSAIVLQGWTLGLFSQRQKKAGSPYAVPRSNPLF